MANEFSEVIQTLEEQRNAIDSALTALRGANGASAAPANGTREIQEPIAMRGGKRELTPEGRERLAQAMRRRWAAKRAAPVNRRGRPRKVA